MGDPRKAGDLLDHGDGVVPATRSEGLVGGGLDLQTPFAAESGHAGVDLDALAFEATVTQAFEDEPGGCPHVE